jgi:integrase
VTQRPTLPFEDADVERILKAADQISDWGTFGPKARAMVLLLRYSGLRMQDGACLERARLKNGKLFLYTQKTGTPVNCPLPPVAVSALNDLSNAHADYFFWDGRSERETTVKSWNRVFRKMFRSAKPPIEGGHPHRFRDTFAVSLLLKGVELTHVSILLGHASIKITERHTALRRREQFEADVQRTWEQVPPAPPASAPAGRAARRRTAGRAARDNAASPAVA